MMQLPEDFLKLISESAVDDVDALVSSLSSSPSVSVRLNRVKSPMALRSPLQSFPVDSCVPWCEEGHYLSFRPESFTLDPYMHCGVYYVQEASSMILSYLCRQLITTPVRFLDLCAAPGGKSTLLLDSLPEGSLLVANEYIRQRSYILAENVIKWGRENAVVCCNDASSFGALGPQFDAMLVDAPCSGEGMFRKDEEAIRDWSLDNVRKCVSRQREILTSSWSALKPGGLVIYSTCTFNRYENEEMTDFICTELGAERLHISYDASWGIVDSGKGWHFYPHKTRGEGLFVSVMRKKGEPTERAEFKSNRKSKPSSTDVEAVRWLKDSNEYELTVSGDRFIALPNKHAGFIRRLQLSLHVLHCGVPLGTFKGKSFLPDAALALSESLDYSKVNECKVDKVQALRFLHRDSLQLPSDTPRGIVLITYNDVALGWVKNIGNRTNTLMPEQWRIRMNVP